MTLAASCSGGGPTTSLSRTASNGAGAHGSPPAGSTDGSHPRGSGTTSSSIASGAQSNPPSGSSTAPANPSNGTTTTTAARAPGGGGGTGATSPQQTQVIEGGKLPSLSDAFNADNSSFQSVATTTKKALSQLPSGASDGTISQTVAPLTKAATTYQAELLNLRWTASEKTTAQALSETLGQLTAVLMEPQRAIGFSSVAQFRTQVTTAVGTVVAASSSVSSTLS